MSPLFTDLTSSHHWHLGYSLTSVSELGMIVPSSAGGNKSRPLSTERERRWRVSVGRGVC